MKLIEDAQTCVGSYDFHAYCKYENKDHEYREFPHLPHPAETQRQAKAILRAQGWVFHFDGTGTCPKCAKVLKGGDA